MTKRYLVGAAVVVCMMSVGCGDLDPMAPSATNTPSSGATVTPREWIPLPPGDPGPCGPDEPDCGIPHPVPPHDPSPCNGAPDCGIVFTAPGELWY